MRAHRRTELALERHEIFDAEVVSEASNIGGYKHGSHKMEVRRVYIDDYLDGRGPALTAVGRRYSKMTGELGANTAFAKIPLVAVPDGPVRFAIQRIMRQAEQGARL